MKEKERKTGNYTVYQPDALITLSTDCLVNMRKQQQRPALIQTDKSGDCSN